MKEGLEEAKNTINWLFWPPVDENLAKILGMADDLKKKMPEIITKIRADQDRSALGKKEQRAADEQWRAAHNQPALFDDKKWCNPHSEKAADLKDGRPRISPVAAYLFLTCRGLFGKGLYTQEVWSRLCDSMTFRGYIDPHIKTFPSATAVSDHLNNISSDTIDFIFKCQLAHVMDLGLDEFDLVCIDSTHVHSHSEWPTDSGLILKFLERAFNIGQKLHKFGLPGFRIFACKKWLHELNQLNFQINLSKGKNNARFRKHYKNFLKLSGKFGERLCKEYERLEDDVEKIDILPSRRAILEHMWSLLFDSMVDAHILGEVAYCRVVKREEFTREDFEKIFSVSDGSAAFIKKGGRETVFGYRVQLVRSRNGFITNTIVPEGNVPDSQMLVPTVQAHIANTHIIPTSVSVDDGYASRAGVDELKELKVENVSISGSKGKKLTSDEDWNSEVFRDLRNLRSAVESLMFTGKYHHSFGQFSRSGMVAVQAEMMEKSIAHNFWRIVHEQAKRRKPVATAESAA